jgi:hypothetical protein
MIRSGVVKIATETCGTIQDGQGREFYFGVQDCVEGKVPKLHSFVTFVKDPDFKSTDVALLVKPAVIQRKAA